MNGSARLVDEERQNESKYGESQNQYDGTKNSFAQPSFGWHLSLVLYSDSVDVNPRSSNDRSRFAEFR